MLATTPGHSAQLLLAADRHDAPVLRCNAMVSMSADFPAAMAGSGLSSLAKQNPRLLEEVLDSERRVRQQHLWRQGQLIVEATTVAKDAHAEQEEEEKFYKEEPMPWLAIGMVVVASLVYSQVSKLSGDYTWLVPLVNMIMLLGVLGGGINFLR